MYPLTIRQYAAYRRAMSGSTTLPLLQVDAFSRDPFGGNPAAIVMLDAARDTAWLQAVAGEMNLSETAFLLPRGESRFHLRWFTPAVEVQLCGHATLASAFALWSTGRAPAGTPIVFDTLSGPLTARAEADGAITIDLPLRPVVAATLPDGIAAALGVEPIAVRAARKGPGDTDYLVECADEAMVIEARPDFGALKAIDGGIMLTARASTPGWDFVSRYFVPAFGIDEDPVTGSAHCALGPYWAERLGRTSMTARQVSKRGGTLLVTVDGDRVRLSGHAVTVLSGQLVA
jgi:PhzF family phenazine biosynthesis protein